MQLLANFLYVLPITIIQEGSDSDDGPVWMEDEEEEESLAQVAVPSQKDIEEMLIRRRKKVGPQIVLFFTCYIVWHCIDCWMQKLTAYKLHFLCKG